MVINLWAGYCEPCLKEVPALARLTSVPVLGISTKDNAENAVAKAKKFGLTYPSLYDFDGRLLRSLKGVGQLLPTTIIIDSNGKIARKYQSRALTDETLRELVADVA